MANNRASAMSFGIIMIAVGTLLAAASAYIGNWLTWIVFLVSIFLILVGVVAIYTARKGSDEELARFTGRSIRKE